MSSTWRRFALHDAGGLQGMGKGPSPERAATTRLRRKQSPDHASGSGSIRPKSDRVSPSKGPESGRPKLRSLLRSDTQAGPTRRCPPDGYDVSWMRVSQSNENVANMGRLDGKVAAVT